MAPVDHQLVVPETYRVGLELALKQAEQAHLAQQLPIGCVIEGPDGTVLAQAHNEIESRGIRGDKTAHAELIALAKVAKTEKPDPSEWTLYTSLEPCPMCIAASVLVGVGKVVWATSDPKLAESKHFDDLPPDKNKDRIIRVACPLADLEEKSRYLYEVGRKARKERRVLETLSTQRRELQGFGLQGMPQGAYVRPPAPK